MPGRNLFRIQVPALNKDGSVTIPGPVPEDVDFDQPPCVFISYRHVDPDKTIAKQAAQLLMAIGLDVFFDENDACLKAAASMGSAVALCIEAGLDRSTALFGIITPNTFESPWIPYEIGGARGRKRKFFHPRTRAAAATDFGGGDHAPFDAAVREVAAEVGHQTVAIAHLIHARVDRVPEYVRLGYPLADLAGLQDWARALLGMHGRRLEQGIDPVMQKLNLATLRDALRRIRPLEFGD